MLKNNGKVVNDGKNEKNGTINKEEKLESIKKKEGRHHQ